MSRSSTPRTPRLRLSLPNDKSRPTPAGNHGGIAGPRRYRDGRIGNAGPWRAARRTWSRAVVANSLAPQENTRERVPLDWAETQMNLTNALERLGERESARHTWSRPWRPTAWPCMSAPASACRSTGRRPGSIWGLLLWPSKRDSPSADTTREALTCFQQAGPILRDAGMTQTADIADRLIDRLQHELSNDTPPAELQKPPG
jgi:hypothetical protein